ncbi:MAG: hypothetical protein LBM02_05900 [Lachnospiraceae bacterium]|jgi:transcription elongation factor Elf1|nr:hypothetical protein [Lachnospiraceae bacterium]
MGKGYLFHCDNCHYTFEANLGIGFLFLAVYKNTIKEIQKGKYGIKIKDFLLDYKDAAISCEQVLFQCENCNSLDSGLDLSMYLPDLKYEKKLTNIYDYHLDFELKSKYKLYSKYPHLCKKCGSTMTIYNEDELEELISQNKFQCPVCNKELEVSLSLMWD